MENIENMEVVIENDISIGETAEQESPAASLEIVTQQDITDGLFCNKCLQRENRQTLPGLVCLKCEKFTHLACLKSLTPGNITGDVFFEFTCAGCSRTKCEVFVRKKATFTWLNAIYLTLYHLTIHSFGISNRGFFHYKTHIASFIDRNWQILFGPQFKQKKKWIGTIAGQLSMHSGSFFNSGTQHLQEGGWWQPKYKFSPAVAYHIWQELTREKWVNNRLYKQSSFQKSSLKEFVQMVWQLGYDDLLVPYEPVFQINSDMPEAAEQTDELITVPQPKKAQNEFKIVYYNCDGQEAVMESDQVIPADANLQIINAADIEGQLPTSVILPGSYEDAVAAGELTSQEYIDETAEPIYITPKQSYLTPININQKTIKCVNLNMLTSRADRNHVTDSEETLSAASSQMVDQDTHIEEIDKRLEERRERKLEWYDRKAESLFSFLQNSTRKPSFLPETTKPNLKLVQMSEYEEVQLLKRIDSFIGDVGDLSKRYELRRFRAKLALRRLKRIKRIPVFDIDKTVKALCGYATGDEERQTFGERVLDRFQTSFVQERLSGSIPRAARGPLPVSEPPACALRSPRSGLTLRPYIRRDGDTTPVWLAIGEELLHRTRHKNPEFVYNRATIDYCYIRPHHVAAVNRLLSEFFWPGIDISESLQYPEYSCVVSYKSIVVGCALCVPETTREAYVSFVVVRPEWRRAKIATTMLYHLLQTTTGMDVTLHVSPTNPAIFLYQKFGFKVEEFIQDFYEKYYDIDYKGCRHALFLRLVR